MGGLMPLHSTVWKVLMMVLKLPSLVGAAAGARNLAKLLIRKRRRAVDELGCDIFRLPKSILRMHVDLPRAIDRAHGAVGTTTAFGQSFGTVVVHLHFFAILLIILSSLAQAC